MQLVTAKTPDNIDTEIYSRVEEMAYGNNGLWHFDEQEVFIADAQTRVMVNSIPELANIIMHFSFEWAKAQVMSVNDMLGESYFSESYIDDAVWADVTAMTNGKQREIYCKLRQRLMRLESQNPKQEDDNKPRLKFIPRTTAAVVDVSMPDQDSLVKTMKEGLLFEAGNEIALSSAELALTEIIGEFIDEHCSRCDREQCLDLLRMALSF